MRKQRVGGFRWRILGLLLAMVLLVACGGQTGSNPPGGGGGAGGGGSGGGGGGGGGLVASVNEVRGRIINWTPGSRMEAFIGAMAEWAGHYGQVTVSASGDFVYRLPTPSPQHLSQPFSQVLRGFDNCAVFQRPTVTPEDSRGAFLYLVVPDQGVVFLSNDERGTVMGAYMYVNRNTWIQGELRANCQGQQLSWRYDIRAPAGWSYAEFVGNNQPVAAATSRDAPSPGMSWRILRGY